jgi:hypothetical protein
MEGICGNLFTRPNLLDAPGQVVQGHKHNFDHMTIFWRGWWLVEAELPDGRIITRQFASENYERNENELSGHDYKPVGAHCLIRADVKHKITLLGCDKRGGLFWCVYAHRSPQGEVTQQATGFEAAYH